jgi:hypothetical protein
MESRLTIQFDDQKLAEAFGVTVDDIHEYLTDGRRVSFIIERRLKWAHPGWELAPSEGAGYDLRAPDGGLWEVRSITQGGVYFNPSAQVGSGRRFEEAGFLTKLDAVAGFILSDITLFPSIKVFKISVDHVKRWCRQCELNANARVSRAVFYSRLLPQLPCEA